MDGINSCGTLEEEIMYALHPHGMRMRELMGYLRVYNRPLMIRTLNRLKDEGQLRTVAKSDPANMEFYDVWEVVKFDF